jgi:hypothetical protein
LYSLKLTICAREFHRVFTAAALANSPLNNFNMVSQHFRFPFPVQLLPLIVLRLVQSVDQRLKFKYTMEAVLGMQYLSEQIVIGRYVAVLNCLLTESLEPKVFDFSLSDNPMKVKATQ